MQCNSGMLCVKRLISDRSTRRVPAVPVATLTPKSASPIFRNKMIQLCQLRPRFFLIAGSASRSAAADVVDRAHEFVREFTKNVLSAGDGFVVFVASEPINGTDQPLVFDWTILREIDATFPEQVASPRVIIVSSERTRREKMNAEQRQLIARLAQRGLIEIVNLPDDLVTGGNVGDQQAERAAGMIAIGGGKGVADRAHKLMKKGLPVYPMDLQIGALSEDGEGAIALHRAFMSAPLPFLSHTGEVARSKSLALSLDEPIQPLRAVAAEVVAILDEEIAATASAAPTDVLVLTALAVELNAARVAFNIDDQTPTSKTSIGHNHWRAQIAASSGRLVTCTVATFGAAGNMDAAAATASLLAEFRPKMVVMIGIAAGMRGKCALGDVVISDRVVAYEGAALMEGGVSQPRPEVFRPAFKVQQDITTYLAARSSVTARLNQAWQAHGIHLPQTSEAGEVSKDVMPKPATVASGEKLVREPDKFRQLRDIHGKVEVAEMEAAGIFTACTQYQTPALVIRGISDFGDSTKDNQFHELAAKAAAIVAADFVAAGLTL
jgi:nucleoside phosphorylase